MSQAPGGKALNLTMDADGVYREDVYTDRKVGTIRVLTPIRSDGARDASRETIENLVVDVGQDQFQRAGAVDDVDGLVLESETLVGVALARGLVK